MEEHRRRRLILSWLETRWQERPELSLGEILECLCWLEEKHGKVASLSDDALLRALERGWKEKEEKA